jgi:hypothetical protein
MSQNIFTNYIPVDIILNDILVRLSNYDLFHFGMTCKQNQKLSEHIWEKRYYLFVSQPYLYSTFPLSPNVRNISEKHGLLNDLFYIDNKKFHIIYSIKTYFPVLQGLYWYTLYTTQFRLTFCQVLKNTFLLKDFNDYKSTNGHIFDDRRSLNFETLEETFEYIYRNKTILRNNKLGIVRDTIREKMIAMIRNNHSPFPGMKRKSELANKYYFLIFGKI